jgi:hypothetical protein
MLNISTRLLPLNSLIWNGENEIIAAGHVCRIPSTCRQKHNTRLTCIV